MQKICLLASGNLGLIVLRDLYNSFHQIVAVFTDFRSKELIDFCNRNNIPIYIGNPRQGKASTFIKNLSCDLVLSVNYLFIIEEDIINLPKKYAINLHGSLLPKYKGRTPHVWAIINGEKETGITAHLIDEKVDNGEIIYQKTLPINDRDTGATILEKFNILYPKIIYEILDNIEDNQIDLRPQDSTKAIYFGKRTPEDGRINWDWSRKRIYDWIRAQAAPYPGAFTFFNDVKITIHKSEFSDWGFNQHEQNGKILSCGPDFGIIKTPTGALKIEKIILSKNISLRKGIILR